MNAPASSEILTNWRIKSWFPELEVQKQALLRAYFNELLKFNKTVNLIPPKSLLHCDLIHFASCISGCKIVRKKVNEINNLYDIGSGNGLPGVVYGILFPQQKVILVDIDDRKAEFLKHVVTTLNLTNISVEIKRVEAYPPDSISQGLCRGFASLTQTLLALRKNVILGGAIYNFKSDEWSKEVLQIPSQLCSSWRPSMIGEYKLPITDTKLYIVEAIKI